MARSTPRTCWRRGGDWGIVGCQPAAAGSARPPRPAGRALHGPATRRRRRTARIVGCVRQTLVAPENPAAVVGADGRRHLPHRQPDHHGEGLLPRSGHRPARCEPSRHRARPRASRRAALGGRAYRRRAARSAAPPGSRRSPCSLRQPAAQRRLLAGLVRDFAASRDAALAAWIEANVALPRHHGGSHRASGDGAGP